VFVSLSMLCVDLLLLPPHIQGTALRKATDRRWQAAPGALPGKYIPYHHREGSSRQWRCRNVPCSLLLSL
jgi:hypothetical protein